MFSGLEIAFVSVNKFQIELKRKQGFYWAKVFSTYKKHPGRFISAMLVGNSIALVVYGIFMAELIEPTVELYFSSSAIVLFIQTCISTLLILLAAEFFPKLLFRINPAVMLHTFVWPAKLFYSLLYPLVFVTSNCAEWLLKYLFGFKIIKEDEGFSKLDLSNFLDEAVSKTENEEDIEHEITIFRNALDFAEVKARECMIPRTEIVALDISSSIEQLHALFIETGLSKILIYRGTIDHIIGYVHSYEIFNNPKNIGEVLLPTFNVPEAMPATELLKMFTQRHISVAVVLDEFGGTAGMVTVEDIMEEIFGEIDDEHDTEELIENVVSETEWIFSARLEIDYLNSEFGMEFPESEDYTTLGGYIIHHHESIPTKNEQIEIEPYRFTALDVKHNRLMTVKVELNKYEK